MEICLSVTPLVTRKGDTLRAPAVHGVSSFIQSMFRFFVSRFLIINVLVDPLEVAGLWSGFYRARDVWDQFSQLAFCNILVGTVPVTFMITITTTDRHSIRYP